MTESSRLAVLVVGLGLSALLGGCESVDPSAEMALSARHIEARTGQHVQWPWLAGGENGEVWDGRTELTARQAVSLALMNSPAIRGDLARIAAARADLVQAGLLPNPVFGLWLGWGSGSAPDMLTATVMQSLSSLWLLPSRKEAAQADLQQTVLRVSNSTIALAARVEKTHRRVAYFQSLVPVLAEQREFLLRAQGAAHVKLAAGMGISLDVNRIRAELLEVEVQQRSAGTDFAVEKRRLLEMLNRADGPAEWVAALDKDANDASSVPGEAALASLAKQYRLDLQAATWTVRAQQARLRESRLQALPNVDLGADVEREKGGGESMTTAGPSLRVEVPIFDQGQARIAKARAELERMLMDAQAAKQKATLEVRESLRAFSNAADQSKAYRIQIVPLAEQNVREAQAAFGTGEVDLLDLLMAQRDWTKARSSLLKFELERDLALIDLANAVGGRLVLEKAKKHPE
jgi:cobalt-zinc-cadmium efflux system outer membrane protein